MVTTFFRLMFVEEMSWDKKLRDLIIGQNAARNPRQDGMDARLRHTESL